MSNLDKFIDLLIDYMERIHLLPSTMDRKIYPYVAMKYMFENDKAVREWVAENHKALMDDFLKKVGEEEI